MIVNFRNEKGLFERVEQLLNLEKVEKALAEFAKARTLIQSNERDTNANKVGCAIS